MDDAESELFKQSLLGALERRSGAALDVALDDLGWHEALSADRRTAVSLLFELQGAANAHSSALGILLGTALGLEDRPAVAAVLPPLGQWHAPGRSVQGPLVVRGLGTAATVGGATALIVTSTERGELALEVSLADVALRPVHGIDPGLGLVEMAGDGVPFTRRAVLAPGRWPQAVDLTRLAIGHELVGAARSMLELARGHSLQRIQFGRPIGSFQAVRHRLADSLITIEAADAALDAAWEGPSPQAAAMAKAHAGRSARTVARHCQQVLGGIGFTTEHDLHRYVRRILVLDELFGSSRTLSRDIGERLLATRQLPPLLPL